jgi:succinate dehydrogenase flavin-adding protein (antitoxin of CptAB toxin-antitoxin module)
MRELDELLLNYVECRYAQAPADEKTGFAALLELPDPQLAGYLLQGRVPESPVLARLIRDILGDAAC